MPRIATIVEGQGDAESLPILLRRIASRLRPEIVLDLPRPIRVSRDRIVKRNELERPLELAARRAGRSGHILILLDADDDCPAKLGPGLIRRAREARPDRRVFVVIAKSEYESWFLASAASVAGKRGIAGAISAPPAPESIRDAKGWLSARMPPGRRYRPTLDQAALTSQFDLVAARLASSSFDKLWRDMEELLES